MCIRFATRPALMDSDEMVIGLSVMANYCNFVAGDRWLRLMRPDWLGQSRQPTKLSNRLCPVAVSGPRESQRSGKLQVT